MARLASIWAGLAACAVLLACPAAASAISEAPDAPGYTLAGGSAEVRAIFRLGDTIYIGGSFTSVNGQPRTNLAAISAADGSLTSWAPATDGDVYALAAAGSTIYAGGQFANAGSPPTTPRVAAAAFDATSGALLGWNPHPDNRVEALAVSGSRVYMGGIFGSTNNAAVATTNLASVDATTGAADSSWKPNPDGEVDALVTDGTFVYPAGYYVSIGGLPRNGLAAVKMSDGTVDPSWDPSEPGSNGGSVDAIAITPDRSTIYVTGDFFVNLPPGLSMGHADRWKAAGLEPAGSGRIGNATPFDPVPDGEGYALAATASSVYYGASFLDYFNWNGGSIARNNLGALDPTTGEPQAWDPSPAGGVSALVASPDGSVYVGGNFGSMTQPPAAVGFASFSLPPASTAAPSVTGTPQPGQTLTCVNGTWSGSTPQSYSYQLLRDGAATGAPGPTTTYAVTADDVGHTIGCRVAAQNRVTTASADSASVTVAAAPVATTDSGPTAPPPAGLARPVLFKKVNVVPVSGTVRVKLPGAASFILIQDARQVPVGTIVDVTHGTVQIVSARDALGGTQTGKFFGGLFKIVQLPGKPPITELILVGGNFKLCRAHAAVVVAAGKRSRSIRHLWGDATGAFRTKGRYASATVRGTRWLTDDRCDGTLVKVVKGAVTVRDLVRRKSIALRAVHQYLAAVPRKRRK
ncbi:MAG: hypothetical protein ACJ76Z_12065 [Thermoleophilaceae bacterium]